MKFSSIMYLQNITVLPTRSWILSLTMTSITAWARRGTGGHPVDDEVEGRGKYR